MPIEIPKVPKFCEIPPKVPMFSKDDEREKEKDRRKGRLPGYLDLDKDDRESDYERDGESDYKSDQESDYESDRAYSEFISRLEDDEDGGEGGVKEEEKEKEKEKRKEKARPKVNLYARLYFERVLLYFGKLTEKIVDRFLELIMYGNMANPKKKTRLYIHSTTGGNLNAAVRLYDLMQHASSGLDTVCTGITVSTATFILSGGNKREAFDHSRIMIGEPKRIPPKRIPPILKKKKKIDWKDVCFANQGEPKLTRILIEQLAKRTGKSEQTVKKTLECPKIMSVEEAQIHGIIDSLVDEFIM